MSPNRWILHVFDLNTFIHTCWMHSLPWHPLSSSMGFLVFVKGINQWLVIGRCFIMFNLNTSIHVMGNVPLVFYVEDPRVWRHYIYATTLITTIPMGFKLSYQSIAKCLHSVWRLDSTMYCAWMWPLMTYVYYSDSWPLYLYVSRTTRCTPYLQSCVHSYHWIMQMSGYLFHLNLHYSTLGTIIMYSGHHVPL